MNNYDWCISKEMSELIEIELEKKIMEWYKRQTSEWSKMLLVKENEITYLKKKVK